MKRVTPPDSATARDKSAGQLDPPSSTPSAAVSGSKVEEVAASSPAATTPGLRLDMNEPVDRDERTYTLTISHSMLGRPRLTPFDRKLLAECDSPDATVADRLLGLELLVRRIEEATR